METSTNMNVDCINQGLSKSVENEIIESWTFLGDESPKTIRQLSGVDNIVEHHDVDETKSSAKTIRSNSSCLSDNFLSVNNHAADGDISDGISVISDCDSISDRHSPMPTKIELRKRSVDDTNDTDKNKTSGAEDINSYTLVHRSMDNEVQVLSSSHNTDRCYVSVWNPLNIILFGLIVGAAAILSSQCWKINVSHEAIMPEMTLLARRIQDLESENLALKVAVNRLVELHHAGHDHSRPREKVVEKGPHEKVVEKRSVKQKKVWTGADDKPTLIPKEPVKENYCRDEYLDADNLFASYNFKRCENIDDSKTQKNQKVKSKVGSNDEQIIASDNSSQPFGSRRTKNLAKDDGASVKREKFAETKYKNVENERPAPETDENVRNEKFAQIQEERQKIIDEATQKYLAKQKKMETKQGKDRKNREDVLKESKSGRKPAKDTDSEWYEKMMKQREELRLKGGNFGGKQQNKENWYTERANEREKVRGKHEKQTKSKQYR